MNEGSISTKRENMTIIDVSQLRGVISLGAFTILQECHLSGTTNLCEYKYSVKQMSPQ